jgi:CpeT protein
MRALPLSLLLLACGGAPSSDDTAVADDAAIAVEDRLASWLAGEFDSADQAATDGAYYAISMRLCPVEVPALGARVLYIEQATMDALDEPYRQRLYVVESVSADVAVSRVYEATRSSTESALVGLCEDPAAARIDAADFALRGGCDVVLTWDGARFTGGTEGEDCESSLGGAAYATSAVTLTPEALTSWDQGWDDQGEQVWGAVDGPYVFTRRTAAPAD